eukprot:TRINITY_DN8747_c0_g1_i1.p1 TRINITY_DN8747_c0_g1~~TRINITY_DN8747_c0_g1_i1.p1  ORF type:complete len:118 (-),score=29.01 TRINITY_DN8747_c0_g1_i1:61-363(-)
MSTDIQIVKYQTNNNSYELACNPTLPMKYRDGKLDHIPSVLAIEEVFFSISSGDKPSKDQLELDFGTSKRKDIFKIILDEGEIEYTPEEREMINLRQGNY